MINIFFHITIIISLIKSAPVLDHLGYILTTLATLNIIQIRTWTNLKNTNILVSSRFNNIRRQTYIKISNKLLIVD